MLHNYTLIGQTLGSTEMEESGLETIVLCMFEIITSNACLRSVHNMMLHHMLCCVAFVLTLVTKQHNARIDSDPILAFLCVASLRLITKKSQL